MPHKRFTWADRIKDAEREYQAVRIGVDWLLGAQPDEIHDLTDAKEWDDTAAADVYAADRNLDATYLIRMFSVFERAVSSYWRLLTNNAGRDIDGNVLLDEVGIECKIFTDVIRNAQAVRVHRNNLVHGRIEDYAAVMAFHNARHDLLTYLEWLPNEWSGSI